MSSATQIQGGCHCGAVRYSILLGDALLPLKADYCHCDGCRLTLGFFCCIFTGERIPPTNYTISEREDGALVRYNSSTHGIRTHCGTCGTSLTFRDTYKGFIGIHAPTIDLPDGVTLDAIVKPEYHIFVGDTFLGGITTMIDDNLPRYARWPDDGPWKAPEKLEMSPSSNADEMLGGCHCGGIQFNIRRPPENSAEDPILRDWVKAGRKLSAIHCFCDTCRLASGAPLWTWAFVPRKLLTFTANTTERVYSSHPTKPIKRRFCGVCGCTYAYAVRQDMWDISAAVLEPAKIEAWLTFSPAPNGEDPTDAALGTYIHGWLNSPEVRPISYVSDGELYNPQLVEAVRRGRANSERF